MIIFQKLKKNATLGSEQTEALNRLRKTLRGPSRVSFVYKTDEQNTSGPDMTKTALHLSLSILCIFE